MFKATGIRQLSIAAGLLLAAVLSVLPVLDQQARSNYDSLFQRAFVTFALARTLNGVISVVQGTELALQPAGVGVTLTPGEILDPVNDLVERFSWIMLGATVSLGIQQVLLDVSAWWLLQGLVTVLALWLLFAYLSRTGAKTTGRVVLLRVFMIALFLRFAVPITLIANNVVYDLFLESRYVESSEVVQSAGAEIEAIGRPESPEDADVDSGGGFGSGFFGSIGQAVSKSRDALDLGEKVERIKARAAQMIEHLIQLSVVFILQTGVMPIVFLWLFLQLGKWVIRYKRT